jgi:N-acetylmuramoyl-L-alanine amidase
MGFLGQVRVGVCRGVCGVALVCGVAFGASTHTARPGTAATAWDQASRARAAFEAQPAGTRTRAGYARVLDGFRAIYHGDPADVHAPDAVNAVAELLAEQGREFEDQKSLLAALGQYEFLRTQYPASSLRGPALLAEARIERDDLDDAAAAKEKFQALLKESPRSEPGRTARAELADLKAVAAPTHREDAATSAARIVPVPARSVATGDETTGHPAAKFSSSPVVREADSSAALRNDKQDGKTVVLAQVTGIRHWSTASYTRVAIDLGDEVKFEAARVPNPDRIYFDLHGAKLAQDLVGKSFNVTDDGFLKRIRAAQAPGDVTRVVLDVSDVTEYSAFLLPNPYRLIIDIHGKKDREEGPGKSEEKAVEVPMAAATTASAAANVSGLPAMAPTNGGDAVRPTVPVVVGSRVSELRRGAPSAVTMPKPVPNTVAVAKPATSVEVAAVSDSPGRVDATSAPTSKPIVVKNRAEGKGKSLPVDAGPAKAADKTADGETSLVRALGLKINRIVIDAGHGGHDSGTLGVDGIQEKDVVLDVALRVGKLLHERLGAEIIYTRSDDTFIPLETRTAIANKAQADLFLSIHANSSPDPTARGVEVYYLNFTSDPTALDVAARENAVSGASIHQLSDLVKKITLKDKIAESREFAADVEGSLYAGLTKGNAGLKDRGVKKAPFVVLIGANMPSILAEISFVTNDKDATELREPEYRQRVAESLYAGVAKYESGLAGTKSVAPVPLRRASLQ